MAIPEWKGRDTKPITFVAPWFERVDLEARCVYLSGRDGLIE